MSRKGRDKKEALNLTDKIEIIRLATAIVTLIKSIIALFSK